VLGGDPVFDGVQLYRAIGARELSDLLRFGDYGMSVSESGKYFALTEEGIRAFAAHPFNLGRRLTLTRIRVPRTLLEVGFLFDDIGGAGPSVHFSDQALPEIYAVMGLPTIIDAAWVSLLDRGGAA
jgi:hypothetical protein